MSWTVKLVGTNIYLNTATDGSVEDTTIQSLISSSNAEQMDVHIYAANPQRTYNVESNIIDSNLVTVSGEYVDEMTMHLLPFKFPTDDNLRENMIAFVTRYNWYYARNSDYPGWWQSRSASDKWWAVRIVAIEHEHKHQTAVKYVRLKLHFTRW